MAGPIGWSLFAKKSEFEHQILLFCWLFACSFFSPQLSSELPVKRMGIPVALSIGILIRILLIHSPSFYEDDFHRYIIEGQAYAKGLDPYITSVEDFGKTILSQPEKFTFEQRRELYEHTMQAGYSWLSAIYPPLIIHWFSLSADLSNLGYFTLLIELIALGICWVILPGKKKYLLLLWLFHPLVLMEGYLNKHYDLLIGLCILICLGCRIRQWYKLAGFTLALGIHLKGYALIYLPFFQRKIIWSTLITLASLELISYLWFPSRFEADASMGLFLSIWEFNNGIFTGLRILAQNFWEAQTATLYLRIFFLSCMSLGLFLLYRYRTKVSISPFLLSTVLFMLFSPVVNPWYLLMSIPFFLLESKSIRSWYILSPCALYYLLFLFGDPLNALIVTTPATLLILTLSLCEKENPQS